MNPVRVLLVVGQKRRAVRVAQATPEAAQLADFLREISHRQLVPDLQPVFDRPQENVGRDQRVPLYAHQ